MNAVRAWSDALAAWAIPEPVLAGAPESPWVLPREVFVRRADAQLACPIGATYAEGLAALREPGTVLDVGAAAGATSLPLAAAGRVESVTAVDGDRPLLDAFAGRAARLGVPARVLRGRWPDLAAEAGPADVVTCGNVLYNVADLGPFVAALTGHARRRVVAEIAARHPLTELNPLWRRFHGISRPEGPTAEDCVAALRELGVRPRVIRWQRPAEAEHATFAELVAVTRRRLCLPAGRTDEVDRALREFGCDPAVPPDLGSSGRSLVTLVWAGGAGE
ncbi:class I SAM-dependent methyltransferase [Amycolatopsis anabasis]|uniref:class I SAM-dependent methyltransferase n=1 Tax=Amycolatopsis anabasis TaxID=1840409 RepID=UPI00131C3BED|nr:class I SAM-dependent methyltransferase [Amycolatopsis anabasis]